MGYHLSRAESDDWIKSIHKDDVSYLVLTFWCSCDLTSIRREESQISEEEIDKIRNKTVSKLSKPKYRKRGWTPDKIELEAEKVIQNAIHRPYCNSKFGLSDTLIENLENLLRDILRLSIYMLKVSGKFRFPTVKVQKSIYFSTLKNDPSTIAYDILYDIKEKNT